MGHMFEQLEQLKGKPRHAIRAASALCCTVWSIHLFILPRFSDQGVAHAGHDTLQQGIVFLRSCDEPSNACSKRKGAMSSIKQEWVAERLHEQWPLHQGTWRCQQDVSPKLPVRQRHEHWLHVILQPS